MKEYPVKTGSMLFTMVDPHKGHEKDYNRWYERDHFYGGCMTGPFLFAGSRWVATRPLKDLRFPADSPIAKPIDAGSYVSIYWVLDEHHEDHFDWASDQVVKLYASGRGFNERTHVHTLLYYLSWTHYRDDDPVPLELSLDHKYEALVSTSIERHDGVSQTEVDTWLREKHLPGMLAGSPIASCSSWQPIPRPEGNSAPMKIPGLSAEQADRMTTQLYFLESDPRGSWDRFVTLDKEIREAGVGRVVWAGPFLRTNVGTDDYTDELW